MRGQDTGCKVEIKKSNAFTLLELLVVVAIIGLLTTVGAVKFSDLVERANIGATQGNLATLRSAVSMYTASYTLPPATIDMSQSPEFRALVDSEKVYVKCRFPRESPPYGYEVILGDDTGPVTKGKGWYYNSGTGEIFVNSIAVDIKGNSYTSY